MRNYSDEDTAGLKVNVRVCSNYRTITLISQASKILFKLLYTAIIKRLESKMKEQIDIV